jgi:hypothetical protein
MGKSLNRNSSELRGRGTSVIKEASNRSGLESPAIGGNSPVGERQFLKGSIPSTTEHVEFRRNQRGPSRKAKYSLVTDSA